MSHDIHLSRVRKSLTPRREPYWGAPQTKGGFLGVRKLEDGTCTWIARWRDDEDKQRYLSLGQVTDSLDYRKAKGAAEEWFDNAEHGMPEAPTDTVADACRAYVTDLEADDRPDTAHDANTRFKKLVYDHSLGRLPLQKLRTKKLKEWRNGIGGSKANQNRNWTPLRAALNLAVTRGRVSPTVAAQWRAVKPHPDADGRRTVCLNLKQRRALLAECSGNRLRERLAEAPGKHRQLLLAQCDGAFGELVEAAALTGARPGELASANRSQFDNRSATVTFRGKTGERTIPLSPAAKSLFIRVSKGKPPNAPLLAKADGTHWSKEEWHELVRAAAAAAKLPADTVLYTLRHSWITEALRGGMATLDVSRLAGTSLKMIEKHYGHLVVDSARQRLARVTML
jgi:integrase